LHEVERDALCLERTAVDQQGGPGFAEQGGVLVHDTGADPKVVVLDPLAQDGEVCAFDPEPEQGVDG
jgi:hypothetical protein